MQVRMYMAMSVDGLAADAEGKVAFLDEFQDVDYGYAEFITEVSLITMGRKSFEQILGFGEWPYWEKDSLVHTSQPILDPPKRCTPWHDTPRALISAWKEYQAKRPGDLWVLGGPTLCTAYLEQDLIDRMDLFVMPVLLGQGLPLFKPNETCRTLQLERQQSFDNGVVQLSYLRPRPGGRPPAWGPQKTNEPAPVPPKLDPEEC